MLTCEQLLILLAWEAGDLSEGQAAKRLTNGDIVDVREMRLSAIDAAHLFATRGVLPVEGEPLGQARLLRGAIQECLNLLHKIANSHETSAENWNRCCTMNLAMIRVLAETQSEVACAKT